ncbi:hypothetical protein Patl1_12506 [Pistacia atlantica]|uniref:Uncharacterized protein n=1 Tax=Pistacia atlantica TaxID=434234 RepID=A0ACC1ATG6_9ROSI|nr:hypothetical protein Patl1_12506 [Pistacia atlantica]
MATILNFLVAILFLSFISRGYCQCSASDISVTEFRTGFTVQNKLQWRVIIQNPCRCDVWNLTMNCAGFQSAQKIDPSVLSKSGDYCLINGGKPIFASSSFSFNYAWDTTITWDAVSLNVACS